MNPHDLYAQKFYATNGRRLSRRKLANNTYLEPRGDDLAVKLHDTDVVTIHPDGTLTLNSGGWLTATTKDRMNQALREVEAPLQIRTEKGRWYIGQWWTESTPFFDGMRVTRWGEILNASETPNLEKQDRHNAHVRRMIKQYVKGLTPEVVQDLFEKGAKGDCWYCSMVEVESGKPWGERVGNHDHLLSHLEERYYMLSLIHNAVKDRGFGNPDFVMGSIYYDAKNGRVSDYLLTKTVARYLRKRLLEGVTTR